MASAVAASLVERTGRSLDEWIALVCREGPDPLDQGAVRRWLKSEHAVRQNSRWAIARAAARDAGWTPPTLEERIDEQYAGTRARLRSVFDRVRELVEGFGDDVTVEARKSYTPFVRSRQFLAVVPATKSRVDLGVRYVEAPDSGLLHSGRAPGQGTHRISLTSVDEITGEVEDLLRAAYEQNG